jgi:hypothetical protein
LHETHPRRPLAALIYGARRSQRLTIEKVQEVVPHIEYSILWRFLDGHTNSMKNATPSDYRAIFDRLSIPLSDVRIALEDEADQSLRSQLLRFIGEN